MSAERDVAVRAVELAGRAGASDAEAWLSDSRTFSVTVRDGAVEQLVETGTRMLTLRVFADARAAIVSSADLDAAALARLADEGVALAHLAEPDDRAGLPDEAAVAPAPPDLDDPALVERDPPAMISLARRAEAAGRGHDPRITGGEGAVFARSSETTSLANSRGFAGSYRASSCSLSVDVIADDADHKKREGVWWTSDRRLAGVEDPAQVGRTAAERATPARRPQGGSSEHGERGPGQLAGHRSPGRRQTEQPLPPPRRERTGGDHRRPRPRSLPDRHARLRRDLTTGDFSRGAAGIWIEGGELAYPVTEINIAGRLQDMLAGVDASVFGAFSAPTIRIARMMVSGT